MSDGVCGLLHPLARLRSWGPKVEAVFLCQARDALAVDVEPVACSDGRQRARFGRPACCRSRTISSKYRSNPRRRDDLENAGLLAAVVPEGVPLAPWLENQIARLPVHDLIAEKRADSSFEDKLYSSSRLWR